MNAQIRIPILLYHSIAEEASPAFRRSTIHPRDFAAHLACLQARHYTGLTVTEYVQAIKRRIPLPLRPVIITFDDGFADFHANALPILRQYHFPATLYITTGYIGQTSQWLHNEGEGNRPMLTWSQVADLRQQQIECGAHTQSHPQLDTLSPEQAHCEILRSKQVLEQQLGCAVESFAYPYGLYSARVREMVQEAGFSSACGVKHAISSVADDRFALARIMVTADTDLPTFERLLTGEGLRVAPQREQWRTKGWRLMRRLRILGTKKFVMVEQMEGVPSGARNDGGELPSGLGTPCREAARNDESKLLSSTSNGLAQVTQNGEGEFALKVEHGGVVGLPTSRTNGHARPRQSEFAQVISPAPREVWWRLLTLDPEAMVSQSPGWIDCICASGRYEDASRLYETVDGRQFILPMVRRQYWPPLLAIEESPPASWGIGGLVAGDELRVEDYAAVFQELAARPVMRTSIKPNPRTARLWAVAQPANIMAIPRLSHVLDLTGGFDTVWSKRFKSKTRNSIRKAERSGLVVECDTTGRTVSAFYDMFLKSLDRWAKHQHEPRWMARWRGQQRDPKQKIERMVHMMGDASRIWMAWYQGAPAAAILVLQGANAHYTRGVMDINLAGPTNANHLLQRLAIEDACQAGCRMYHMGESGGSVSLAHFKSQFGAQPHPYAEYRLEKLPITQVDAGARQVVKSIIGFKDV